MLSTRATHLVPFALLFVAIGLFVAAGSVASCGGAPFEENPHGDATADSSTPGPDGPEAGDSTVTPEGSSGDDAALDAPQTEDSAPGLDSAPPPDDAPGDAYFVPDVVEETPPSCVGAFACAPAVPSGWQGPVELYAGGVPPPGCTSNFVGPAFDGNDQLDAGPATCGCNCGPAHDVHCQVPTLGFSLSTACSVAGCSATILTPGVCKTFQPNPLICPDPAGAPFVMSMLPSDPDPDGGGSCSPITTVNVPRAAWGLNGRACASAFAPGQADCPAGSICAPKPESPYRTGVCVLQGGDLPCPQTGYTVKQVLYTGIDDMRGCAPACTCGDVSGAQCNGTVSVSPPDSGCGGVATKYPVPFTCQGVRDIGDFLLTLSPAGGSCAPPTQGAPSGSAAPNGPLTFCCTP